MVNLSWIAHYSDGSQFKEGEKRYNELDRQKLSQFELVDSVGAVKCSLSLEDGQVLFYRRRVFAACTDKEHWIYLLGWRRRLSSNGIKQRIYIVSCGGLVTEDTMFRSLWYEPQWMIEEQV